MANKHETLKINQFDNIKCHMPPFKYEEVLRVVLVTVNLFGSMKNTQKKSDVA